jgi:hypothetical protein
MPKEARNNGGKREIDHPLKNIKTNTKSSKTITAPAINICDPLPALYCLVSI